MTTLTFIVGLSVAIQLTAAILALRLIKISGGRGAWIFVAFGLIGMSVRRLHSLYIIAVEGTSLQFNLTFEIVGLVTSLFMICGIIGIGPLFGAIRESSARHRRIIRTAQEGIWDIDEEGRTRLVNQRMADILGTSIQEMVGRPIDEFLEADGIAEWRRGLEELRKEGVNRHDQHLVRKDGSPLWASIAASQVTDRKNNPDGMLLMVSDISARKNMEAEREQMISELRDALASVKTLQGMLPICSSCKKIRDDNGYWKQVEVYIRDNSSAEFTHGICPECMAALYPQFQKKTSAT